MSNTDEEYTDHANSQYADEQGNDIQRSIEQSYEQYINPPDEELMRRLKVMGLMATLNPDDYFPPEWKGLSQQEIAQKSAE